MGFMDGNMSVPAPRKPMPVDKKTIDYTYSSSNNSLDKAANYLMEMLKFMPDYERKSFNYSATDQDFNQYGMVNANGELVFGQVLANLRAIGGAYGVKGLQLLADNAADFQHIDGTQIANIATNSLISKSVWDKALKDMQSETRSYYDIMMTGMNDMSGEKAFSLVVTMLESRTRVSDTMAGIFGSHDQSSSQRIAIFEKWYDQNMTNVDPGKAAFLSFFLNASESFVAHILPMYGKSDELYVDALDKMNAQNFMDTLAAKINGYINTLSGAAKAEAQAIWNAWLDPSSLPAADKNVDPLETDWGEMVYDKLQKEIDKIIHQNITSRVSYRARYKAYKQEKEQYDEKIEEMEQEEFRQEKMARQKQAEQKALDEKIDAQNRENNKVRVAPKAKEKPVQQAKSVAKPAAKPVTAKSVAKPAAKKTTAAAPVKVNSSNKPAPTVVANKPVFRVRQGSVAQTSTATKKVAAVNKVSTAQTKVAVARRKVRPKAKRRVWGRPSVFKL